jgi:hypothetical protein
MMRFTSHSCKLPYVQYPIYAATFDGKEVECWEWDAEIECWVDTEGNRHRPEDLHTACPPYDEYEGYRSIDVPLMGTTLDGQPVRITGWQPHVPQWETDVGEHHAVINCPRPEVGCRHRSIDADWQG